MEREQNTGLTLEKFQHFMLTLEEPPPPRCFVFHKRWTDDPICLAAIEHSLRMFGLEKWTVSEEGMCVYFTEVKEHGTLVDDSPKKVVDDPERVG